MKRILNILMLLALGGCASITVPNYVRDEYPYKRLIYAPFERVRDNTEKTLGHYGWTVAKESDPALFEVERRKTADGVPQTLMFTEVRQTFFFIGTTYTRLNIFLSVLPDGATEIEMRYLGILSVVFKKFYDYRNDKAMKRILDTIEASVK